MTACVRCHGNYSGLKTEHCMVCHETFTNTLAGDRHRIGDHALVTGPNRRRCRTAVEMLKAGLIQNGKGYWTRDRNGAEYWAQDMSRLRLEAHAASGATHDSQLASGANSRPSQTNGQPRVVAA